MKTLDRVAPAVLALGAAMLAACGGDSSDDAPASTLQVVASALDLRQSPRLAAAADDTLWLAWTESSAGGETTVAARVDRSGRVSLWTISPSPTEAARELQIVMAGATPLVAWMEVDGNARRIRVAAWDGQRWTVEQTQEPSGGVYGATRLVTASNGEATLAWAEFIAGGGSHLVSAQRSAGGMWSTRQVIRTVAADTLVSDAPSVAAGRSGSLMAVWTEEANPNTTGQSQVLWASRFDPAQGSWAAGVQVDSGSRYVPEVSHARGDEWVTVWMVGDRPGERRSLQAKRFVNGAWDSLATRIDSAVDEEPRGVTLGSGGSAVRVAWATTPTDFGARYNVRAAQLDTTSGQWSVPALVSGPTSALPSALRLRQSADGRAALAWGTQTGAGDPWIAMLDISGSWKPPLRLEPPEVFGNAADAAPLEAGGWVAAWYRWRTDQRQDVIVRRFP